MSGGFEGYQNPKPRYTEDELDMGVLRVGTSLLGCWVDGAWGQYATPRMVQVANMYGFQLTEDEAGLVSCAISDSYELTEVMHEEVIRLADDAEEFLNNYVAPEGCAFGWFEGEFMLGRITDGDSWPA